MRQHPKMCLWASLPAVVKEETVEESESESEVC